jgi:hypothetical protein
MSGPEHGPAFHPGSEDLTMSQRFALVIATLSAALVIAVGVGASSSAVTATAAPSTAVALTQPSPSPSVQIDTIYVPAPVAPPTITIHKNIPPSHSGEDEEEGGDD